MNPATAFLLVLALLLAGCGGGEYQAPPKANTRTPSGSKPSEGGDSKPTGPSYAKQFETEARAAFDAWGAWSSDKTPANFAKSGAHIYNALRFKFLTERNGHSIANLYKSREFGVLFADWKKTIQPGDWENEPDFKAAKQAYNDIQQQSE